MTQPDRSTSDELTLGGAGPKLMLITFPYALLAIIFMHSDPAFLALSFLNEFYAGIAGFILLGMGLVLWISAIVVFLTDFKKGALIVRGPFAFCRNPIYASWIVCILPALALIYQSGMILTIDAVFYLNFKLSIHGESRLLSRKFGEAYDRYITSVNELLPIPKIF